MVNKFWFSQMENFENKRNVLIGQKFPTGKSKRKICFYPKTVNYLVSPCKGSVNGKQAIKIWQ